MISTISFFHSSPRRKGTGLFISHLYGLKKKRKRKKMPGKEWHSKPITADLTRNEKWCNTGCNTRGLGWFHSICGIPWIAVLGNRVVAVLLTKSWSVWTLTVNLIGDNRSSRSSGSVWVFFYWQQSKAGNVLRTYISFCHSPDKSTHDCALLFITNTTMAHYKSRTLVDMIGLRG